jgi:hypothetical protein
MGKMNDEVERIWKEAIRGGSRIGTVELHHPLFPLDIIDNI